MGAALFRIRGKVWKLGDNIDTDLIIPSRYLNTFKKEELSKGCFADLIPDFCSKVSKGDILVAGKNFGCGSSREHAPLAIKNAGIELIIAKNFARIFYRNAFNIGLPLLESSEVPEHIEEGDIIEVDLKEGIIIRSKDRKIFYAHPIPRLMQQIIRAGGLVEYIQSKNPYKGGGGLSSE